MEFGVLGPLQVRDGDRVVVLPPRRRCLLALLLCRPNAVVSADALVDGLWGDSPPRTAGKSLQIHLHHLRRALGDERRITYRAPGYVLLTQPGESDASRFEALVGQGRSALTAHRTGDAALTLRKALGLWRGAPFEGLDHMTVVADEALRLSEQRWMAEEDLFDAELELGRHADVTARLAALVAQHPFRDRLRGQLMVALYRLGRQAEALEVYRKGRRLVADQLGLEPGPRLRELEHAILTSDPALDVPAVRSGSAQGQHLGAVTGEPVGGPASPAQLPADIADFTGRDGEAGSIARFLTGIDRDGSADGRSERAALAVSVVCGRPGVGKTALAVHVAHGVRDVFSDGQLHVNLRGVESEPMDPSRVLARFLRALGVDGRAIPGQLDERAELYRGLTADRRLLVVLDNAMNERQVRPLLPGSPRCGVLITSRTRLSGLEGAQITDLDGFEPEPALAFLAKVAGADRVTAEITAAERVVSLCGHLPLAVRIAAARVAADPHRSIAGFADRLSEGNRLLDELVTGDLEVRGSVALSYRLLDDRQRRLFRLLGRLPGLEFPGWVAIPLTAGSPESAERLIEGLVAARLVDVVRTDDRDVPRYRLHDLLRVFAMERSATEDRPEQVREALSRLYSTWLYLAEQADDLLGPGQELIRVERSGADGRWRDGRTVSHLISDPLGWLEREHANLVASVLHARELDLHHTTWNLAGCLARFLRAQWHVGDWRVTNDAALEAARSASDGHGEAHALRMSAEMHMDHDRYDEALAALRLASAIFSELNEPLGRAYVQYAMGIAYRMLGQLENAFDCAQNALPVFRKFDDKPGIACALALLGKFCQVEEEALAIFREALDLFNGLGDGYNQANVLIAIGYVLHNSGRNADAEDHFKESLEISEGRNNWSGEMFAHAALGELYTDIGDWGSAETELEAALSISEKFGDRFGRALSLRNIGKLCRQKGRLGEAQNYFDRAYELFAPESVFEKVISV